MSDKSQNHWKSSDRPEDRHFDKLTTNSEIAADSQTNAKGKAEIQKCNPDFPSGSASENPDPDDGSLQIVEAISGKVLAERSKSIAPKHDSVISKENSLPDSNPIAKSNSAELAQRTELNSKEQNFEGGIHRIPIHDHNPELISYRQDMDGESFGHAPKNPNLWKEFFDKQKPRVDFEREHIAQSNAELLYQFFIGSGADVQGHYEKSDPVLQDFVKSPGAQAIRKQYFEAGLPDFTDKLGYGTAQAFSETILKPTFDVAAPPASALVSESTPAKSHMQGLFDRDHLGSVGLQIGGFGNPPKDHYPWAASLARRCDQTGVPNPNGDHVQFQVMNLAGLHSFAYHAPNINDKPVGSKGPMRTIIQIFRWVEPIPQKGDFDE